MVPAAPSTATDTKTVVPLASDHILRCLSWQLQLGDICGPGFLLQNVVQSMKHRAGILNATVRKQVIAVGYLRIERQGSSQAAGNCSSLSIDHTPHRA